MRGARVVRCLAVAPSGIIPAYAGSTRFRLTVRRHCRDHPRICGEHASWSRCPMARAGSSPHMRGARNPLQRAYLDQRIIPAYAGSTCPPVLFDYCHRDHPRICGEHLACWPAMIVFQGSSPHMRGARGRRSPAVAGCRIIPAYAGSTGPRGSCGGCRGDHPRICGEHLHRRYHPSSI